MSDRQLIADLLSALEYHTEQTRPIEFSRVAIEAAREYLRKPAQQQEPSMAYKVKMCPRQECASATKCMSVACSSRAYIKPEQPAQQQEPVAWCPDVCPITGLPFFMWIEHHETGQKVPTYGGPYDSYTIPVRDKDGSYCRERYDHDLGGWLTDEVEDVGVQIVSDQAYVSDESPTSKPWVGLKDDEFKRMWVEYRAAIPRYLCFARAVEAKLQEKNTGETK